MVAIDMSNGQGTAFSMLIVVEGKYRVYTKWEVAVGGESPMPDQ